jgi:hypothetical protein
VLFIILGINRDIPLVGELRTRNYRWWKAWGEGRSGGEHGIQRHGSWRFEKGEESPEDSLSSLFKAVDDIVLKGKTLPEVKRAVYQA